jgi:SAM-dependent MidA family methyltransferase
VASHDLLRFLQGVQEECGGVIPFARFMQEALYHPTLGYYSSQIHDVGSAGDFSTSATLDPLLGEAIAKWIIARAQEKGWKRIPVIEVGAGSGLLARSVLRHLDWKTRWHIDYMICETSPILRSKQQKSLGWHGVQWMDSLKAGLERSGGRALIFSNELVDAFPCRVFQKSKEGWWELGIILHPEGSLSETTFPPIVPIHPDAWFADFTGLPDGQRVERHDSYHEWLGAWGALWKEGYLLTIDYGDVAQNLYSSRPAGSLRAYWKHERITGSQVYARFGKQDLTADVNFSDLIAWGQSLGWREESFTTQREFLSRGISPTKIFGSSSRFLIPGDVGDAFKVLEQSPLLSRPQVL